MGGLAEQFERLDLPVHGVRLPKVEIEEADYLRAGVPPGVTNKEFLRALCEAGKKERGVSGKGYDKRLDYELSTMEELGFTDYILLVWDVINFCRKKNIPVGKGRGSAASSLVLYMIGVTGIDPIEFGLFFERFISKVRAKSKVVDGVQYIDGKLAPDIDLDICHERRGEVVEYLETKYEGKFCKLPTLSTLTSKILIKECGKIVGGYSEDYMRDVADTIPTLYGKVFELEEAERESEKFKEFCDRQPEVLAIAKKLRKLIKNSSSHASAYLVSHDPLEDFIPCETSTNNEVVASWDMHQSMLMCIKLDLLGLQGVTLVDKVCHEIGMSPGDIDTRSFEGVYKHLQDLQTPYGLFQISGDCNLRVTKTIRPKDLSELAAVVSLARPGALAYVDQYAEDVIDNKEKLKYDVLKEILKDGHYLPIFQEHMMAIGHKMFGLSLDETETLRRIVGKKLADEMAQWKGRVYEAAEEKGLPEDAADFYWKILEESASYSFNKSHAVSYADLAAETVYLKFKHPQQFYLAALDMALEKPDPRKDISLIQEELREFGMKLLPPDLVRSEMGFSIDGGDIRFGLSAIKGISSKSLGNVRDFIDREKTNKFECFQAARQAKLNVGILSTLIQAGALGSQDEDRTKLVLESQIWALLTDKEKRFCLAEGAKWDWQLIAMVRDIKNWKYKDGRLVAAKTRFDTIRRNYKKYKEIYLKNREFPDLASYIYEKRLLGYSYSRSLRNIFECELDGALSTVEEVKLKPERAFADCVVEMVEVSVPRTSKSGNRYMRMVGRDETGSFPFMILKEKLYQYLEKNNPPKEEDIVYIRGSKGKDIVWVNEMSIQNYQIYMKLHELKGSADSGVELLEKRGV